LHDLDHVEDEGRNREVVPVEESAGGEKRDRQEVYTLMKAAGRLRRMALDTTGL
jgi:hypothetical protein